MFTRREFLQTTLIAMAMPAAASARHAHGPAWRARLIAIGDCPEGDRFCAAGRDGIARFAWDVGDVLQVLLRGDREPGVSAWYGLTRDSDYTVIRHALLERGAREIYAGSHLHGPAGWRHELRADEQTLERLATALAQEGESWAAALAECRGHFADAHDMTGRRLLTTAACARPPHAARQLRSWSFHA
jgi:hypothetical protein